MHTHPVLPHFKSLGAGLLLFSATLFVVPCALGQSEPEGSTSGGDPSTSGGGSSGGPPPWGEEPNPAAPLGTPTKVGYGSIADGNVPGSTFAFQTFSTGSVVVIPFTFNSLETYALTSVNLLLSTSTGSASLSGLSLEVFSTAPADSTSLPSVVTSFVSTGTATSTLGIHTFTATSSPILEADTTYYLGLTYFGTDTLAWNATIGTPVGSGPVDLSDTYQDGVMFNFYVLNAGVKTDYATQLGGFSITAAAVSAVPEPATTTALAAGAVLTAALWVRWRRRRDGRSGEERPPHA
jgi:hypothetical protein